MLFELENTLKIKALFTGWEETMIFSCLQKIMGKIYVTDLEKPQGFTIIVPQNEGVVVGMQIDYGNADLLKFMSKFDTI